MIQVFYKSVGIIIIIMSKTCYMCSGRIKYPDSPPSRTDGCWYWLLSTDLGGLLKTASSTDLAYRKSGSSVSKCVVCE